MKKIIYFILLIYCICIEAQTSNVGINTANPQRLFHIDGQKDNPKSQTVPDTNQMNNDFAVDKDGFVGIGTLPDNTAKVNVSTDTNIGTEIGKAFRLKDGTEGNGNLLGLKNLDGDVAWIQRVSTIVAKLAPRIDILVNSDLVSTNTTITLPPGKWLIRSSLLLRAQNNDAVGLALDGSFTHGAFAKLSWADANGDGTFTPTADAISGNVFGGAYFSRYGLAYGQTLVNNTSGANKTYHLITRAPAYWGTNIINAKWRGLGNDYWGENSIIAFAAN